MPGVAYHILAECPVARIIGAIWELRATHPVTGVEEGRCARGDDGTAEVTTYGVAIHGEVGDHFVIGGIEADGQDADLDMVRRWQIFEHWAIVGNGHGQP